MMPKVSVIIRTYNRADLIERALKSALRQSFQDLEIIVADDGSTDQTAGIVNQLKLTDSRISFFSQDHVGVPGRPLNLGLRHSHGKYIAILDSDDEWLPSKLEKQVKLLESVDSQIGFVSCYTTLVHPHGTEQEKKPSKTEAPLEMSLMRKFPFAFSSVLAKREVFDYIGPIDENYKIMDDWDAHIRIATKYNYDFVPEPLCRYHVHDSNISFSQDYTRQATDLTYLLNKHLALFKKHPKILEHQYITLASYFVNADDLSKARNYLKKSLYVSPSLKNLARLLLSYVGKTVYQKYLISRRKI